MPNTDAGKVIAARNATSHGLFARDIVLPELGENPAAYDEMFLSLTSEIHPNSLLERMMVEKIAAASWRLRRLHRWQAQLWEDGEQTEGSRMEKLDKTLRHETALHRQIDAAIRMLGGKNLPELLESRARRETLAERGLTEADCKDEPQIAREVAQDVQEKLHYVPFAPDFDKTKFDNTYLSPLALTVKMQLGGSENATGRALLNEYNRTERAALPASGEANSRLRVEGCA